MIYKRHKRNICSLLTLVLIFCFNCNAFAYSVNSSLPASDTLYWGFHSTLPTAGQTPARYAPWSSAINCYYNYTTYSGNITPFDSNNTVGGRVPSVPGLPSNWVAAALTPSTAYTTFDIVINSNETFGSGTGTNYFDYEGVFAHEFGHIYGLADKYYTIATVPDALETMWYASSMSFYENIYYYLRTPTLDDYSGANWVSNNN